MKNLNLPVNKKETLEINDVLAKPDKTLLDHMLEVGIMAEAIMRVGRAKTVIEHFSDLFGINKESLISSIAFLCAVHDIGKCHQSFMTNMIVSSDRNNKMECLTEKYDSIENEVKKFRHERYSAVIIKKYFKENGISGNDYADVLMYHHQGKPGILKEKITNPGIGWEVLQRTLLENIEKKWKFSNELTKIDDYKCGFLDYILGLIICSDWICSGTEWESLLNNNVSDSIYQCTCDFLKCHKLHYKSIETYTNGKTWKDFFDFRPNALQEAMMNIESADLIICEAPCGIGKTEAALAASVHIGSNKSGLYVACPSIATTQPMTKRLRNMIKVVDLNAKIPEFDSSSFWSNDEEDRISPSLWSHASRHQMMYPIATGTIDQLLKTVCMYRYASLGLVGLGDKVVIIDEVHAYDRYMLKELSMLIQYCRFIGVPVILLSATLPSKTKKLLLKAAGCKNAICSDAYPLLTIC